MASIDERLERLTERHEALTGTVELLTADLRDAAQLIAKLAEIVTKHEVRLSRLEGQE